MKTIFSVIAFLLSTQALAYSYPDATYNCSNGTIDVGVYENGPDLEDGQPLWEIFRDSKHVIKVKMNGKEMVYDTNVIMKSDGAGQYAFQAFVPANWQPLVAVVDFYFEHEGGYLVGGFRPLISEDDKGHEDGYGDRVDFEDETMKCEEE